jgi:hypothetical protein
MCPIALLREPKGGQNPGQICLGPPNVGTNAMQDILVHLAASMIHIPILSKIYLGCEELNRVGECGGFRSGMRIHYPVVSKQTM